MAKVKLLIEYGARLDLADVGPMQNTALHLAARHGAATWMVKCLGVREANHALNGGK